MARVPLPKGEAAAAQCRLLTRAPPELLLLSRRGASHKKEFAPSHTTATTLRRPSARPTSG